jgi:hypothetical protein
MPQMRWHGSIIQGSQLVLGGLVACPAARPLPSHVVPTSQQQRRCKPPTNLGRPTNLATNAWCRFRRRQVARKQLRGQMKNFKYLMTGLVKQLGDPTCRHIEGLRAVKELAFVITGEAGWRMF